MRAPGELAPAPGAGVSPSRFWTAADLVYVANVVADAATTTVRATCAALRLLVGADGVPRSPDALRTILYKHHPAFLKTERGVDVMALLDLGEVGATAAVEGYVTTRGVAFRLGGPVHAKERKGLLDSAIRAGTLRILAFKGHERLYHAEDLARVLAAPPPETAPAPPPVVAATRPVTRAEDALRLLDAIRVVAKQAQLKRLKARDAMAQIIKLLEEK